LDRVIADCNEAEARGLKDPSIFQARGWAYDKKHDCIRALANYNAALELDPNDGSTYHHRGNAFRASGHYEHARADLERAVKCNPTDVESLTDVAWLLATCPDSRIRNGSKAVTYATKVCELTAWERSNTLSTLAAACAESGRMADAAKWQTKAVELAASPEAKAKERARLELYKAGKPYHEDAQPACASK
jgi:tetratricopeptide (TPR) repeat protein